jgi:3-oxoadipate enol-lactonase/3-oxoadipate enol-lactonase/4-carboxymuconolactone decarboxylase
MRVSTRGEGPVVVKIAGMAGGVGLYEEEIAAAARAGFRVAALDTTGDRHDDPMTAPLTWDVVADEVVAAIEGTGSAPAILWGTSYGCLVALATAARHPDRVAGLLLCHPPDPRRSPRLYRRLEAWAMRRGNPTRAMRLLFSSWFLLATSWEGLAPPLWIRLTSLLRASLEAGTPAATVRRKIELLFAEEPGLPKDGLPVEIVAGAWDLVAPISGVRALAGRISGARVHVLDVSGHAGAYARPHAYARLSIELLRYLAARGNVVASAS